MSNAAVNPWFAKIKVIAVYPTTSAGTVKALVNIMIGEALEIRGCKIIQQPGQKAWVTLPDRKSPDGNGYFPVVKAHDARLMEAISEVVLAAWKGGAA